MTDPPGDEREPADDADAEGDLEVQGADASGLDVHGLEVRWAAALLSELVESGGIEILGEEELLASGILEELATELAKGPEDLGERLLAVMLDSSGVDEVFISEKALIERLGSSRPADPT